MARIKGISVKDVDLLPLQKITTQTDIVSVTSENVQCNLIIRRQYNKILFYAVDDSCFPNCAEYRVHHPKHVNNDSPTWRLFKSGSASQGL